MAENKETEEQVAEETKSHEKTEEIKENNGTENTETEEQVTDETISDEKPEEIKENGGTENKEMEEQATDKTISDEKPEEIKENGSTEKKAPKKRGRPKKKPAENGDGVKEDSTKKDNGTKKKEEDEDKEDGESSDEELVGSLEKPLIITTKRERKSAEIYIDKGTRKYEKNKFDYSEGKGVALGDIPIVKYNIDKADTEDLHVLHRIMYRSNGKKHNTKRHIREFCGWPFDKESNHFQILKWSLIDRMLPNALKWTLDLLAVDKSGKETEEMRDAMCEFLFLPLQNDMEIPTKTKRKSEGGSNKKSTPKRKDGSAAPRGRPKKKSPDEEVKASDDEEVKASGDDESGAEEKEKEEKPKKKTPQVKKSPKKKAKASGDEEVKASGDDESGVEEKEKEEKPKKKKTPQVKKSPKKKPKTKATQIKILIPAKKSKSPAKKRKPESSDDSSDDEEPLSKKAKAAPPTDAELKNVVATILKDADLELVTMKTVVQEVSDKYSTFDLTSRRDFIKETVRSLIT